MAGRQAKCGRGWPHRTAPRAGPLRGASGAMSEATDIGANPAVLLGDDAVADACAGAATRTLTFPAT